MPTEQGVGGSSPPRRALNHMKANAITPKQPRRRLRSQEHPINPFLSQLDFPLFHKIINNVGDELMLIDKSGRIIFVNNATIQGLGCRKEDLLQKKITDFFKKKISVKEWQRTHFRELKASKQPMTYQVDRTTERGDHETISVTAVYTTFNGQECVLSIARNITRLVLLESELKEAVDFYNLLSEGAGDPILIFNMDGCITYANAVAGKFLETPIRKLVGKHFQDIVHPDSRQDMETAFTRSRKSPGQFCIEIKTLNRKKHEVPFEVTFSSVVHNGQIVAIHTIARDLRPRKELEQLMIDSEKMKGIQYFLTGTAMELKNPLFGVLKKCESLKKKYRDRDFEYIGFREFSELLSTLDSIHQQIKYCVDTTERLVNLSRKKVHMRKTGCYANAVIKDLLSLREDHLQLKKVNYELHLKKGLPMVVIGAIDFHQILTNVINNAVESMPGGGRINIKSSYHPKTDQVLIEVRDNGVGISKELLNHIYEPFFTTKQRGVNKNSGLGLTIVYSLIKACHGTMTVISNLRKGTTVKMLFPAKKPASFSRSKIRQ